MSKVINTQHSEGITTFRQAHEIHTDWADATSLAWDGSWYYLMITETKYSILRYMNFERQISNRCSSNAGGLDH